MSEVERVAHLILHRDDQVSHTTQSQRPIQNRSSIFFYPYEERSIHNECSVFIKIPVFAGTEFWSGFVTGRFGVYSERLRRELFRI
jgi:hypothetical protein